MSNQRSKLEIMRHSCSHVLAQAVLEMFPETKFGIGPAIENGFYYDFDLPRTLIPEDLPILEKKMTKIIKQNLPFDKKLIDRKKAIDLFKKAKQPYKVELLKEMESKKVSIYKQGNFVDLCKGPHLDSTGEIGAFKLLKIAGAYWKGNEKNKMLQRIYGTAFRIKKELKDYLKKQEEIEKRDHRKLGKDLEIFSISKEVGAGLVLWHPKGTMIREIIENFWKKEHRKRGYKLVYSPHIGRIGLWKKSGHWDFYREMMYSPMKIDNVEYLLKPMNCPFHVQIFKTKLYSYKDLPLRFCELGTVYRYEKAGVLHGLLRVRGFTQDDAHIFCTPDQITREIEDVIELAHFMLSSFGFKKYKTDLSLRDPKNKGKYLGSEAIWKKAEKALTDALKRKKLKFTKALGEAVFYGPKIDIKLIDSLGRSWQGPTIQVDFNFPEKFDLSYIGKDGKKHQVVMIHRTVLGSMERFLGILLEHYAGAFPVWLSPIQVEIIPISDKHVKYAKKVLEELEKHNLRVEINEENQTTAKKISSAEKQKIPYMLVVGDKEIRNKKIAVRSRKKGDEGQTTLDKFIKRVIKEVKLRSLDN